MQPRDASRAPRARAWRLIAHALFAWLAWCMAMAILILRQYNAATACTYGYVGWPGASAFGPAPKPRQCAMRTNANAHLNLSCFLGLDA
jgi:hypothetical protein